MTPIVLKPEGTNSGARHLFYHSAASGPATLLLLMPGSLHTQPELTWTFTLSTRLNTILVASVFFPLAVVASATSTTASGCSTLKRGRLGSPCVTTQVHMSCDAEIVSSCAHHDDNLKLSGSTAVALIRTSTSCARSTLPNL